MIFFFILGYAMVRWNVLWSNETEKSIMATALFMSVLSLFSTLYFTVEIALKRESATQNKLLSEYCARFSTDPSIRKVVEWLIAISDIDKNDVITRFYPEKSKDDKGNSIEKPSLYEKERFMRFFVELNIQIKNKQLNERDVNELFSFYAMMFSKVEHVDNDVFDYRKDCSGFREYVEAIK